MAPDLIGGRDAHIFAKVFHRSLVAEGRIPDESTAGRGDRIKTIVGIATPGVPRPIAVIRLRCLREPLMAVGAVSARGIEIVEYHELFRQAVMVGRHITSVNQQARVAVCLGQVPQDLVIGPILFDDEHHVIDQRWVAGAQRHG